MNGIEHVEAATSSLALIKLTFHPGTDMAQAMSETVAAVNRSRAFMPPGTVPPFITRFDTGSVPVGYVLLTSETKSIAQIQDQALFRIRPMFASIPGVSAPPPFGGNQRTIVVSVNPDEIRKQSITLGRSRSRRRRQLVSPVRDRVGDLQFIVDTNVMVGANTKLELGQVPVKLDLTRSPPRHRDHRRHGGHHFNYVLVNGKRSVYLLVTNEPKPPPFRL